MRVIAGKYRHRIIKECNLEGTRETQDRIREAIFNSLGPSINGKVLDLFCGSGALAIEAYSRGASYLYLNDFNKEALKVAKSNLDSLGILDYKLFNLDYLACLKELKETFDYVFLDPPYKYTDVKGIIEALYFNNIVNNNTIIVFEMASTTNYLESTYYELVKEKRYGKKKVLYFKLKV